VKISPAPIQVAVGIVKNPQGEILISLRHDFRHQGGLWEFPGGKIGVSETAEFALVRELKEELGITVTAASPLIVINHQYADLSVELKVFLIDRFSGVAESREGQLLKWVTADELEHYPFPAANQAIIAAVRLPHYYAILDDSNQELLLPNLQKILDRGIKLIQARLKNLSPAAVAKLVQLIYPLCKQRQALLLMNSAVDYPAGVDGIHLTSHDLMALTRRPENTKWLAASCHNLEQLHHAQNIAVDFVVLAPVLATQTHPDKVPLGWQQFSDLVAKTNLPVYALGGMKMSSLSQARQSGGQGIAAIRAFLD
jgi:8-oxo-dGTP diphosphatase